MNRDLYAAAKICVLESEDELEDFTVEIDILTDVSHNNVIELYEAFYHQDKLWVRKDLSQILGRILSQVIGQIGQILSKNLEFVHFEQGTFHDLLLRHISQFRPRKVIIGRNRSN